MERADGLLVGNYDELTVNNSLKVGTSTSKISIATAGTPIIDLHTTTALTAGNSIGMEINCTRTIDSVSGRDWGLKITMTSASYKFPGGVNAIYGSLVLGTGGAHGRAAGVQGEVVMPGGSMVRGTFSCFHADLTCPSGGSWQSSGPLSYLSCIVVDTDNVFDHNGYLFTIEGTGVGADDFADATGAPTANGTIRIRIEGTDRYLLYSNSQH